MIYSKDIVFEKLKRLRNNNNIKINKEKRIIKKFYNINTIYDSIY